MTYVSEARVTRHEFIVHAFGARVDDLDVRQINQEQVIEGLASLPGNKVFDCLSTRRCLADERVVELVQFGEGLMWESSLSSRPGSRSATSLKNLGRVWKRRRIIICRNEGSVAVEKLCQDGTMVWHSLLNLDQFGKSWLDLLPP